MMSRPYFRYLVVGGIVGLLAIAAREILAYVLPEDSPGYYLLSVIIIYAGGLCRRVCPGLFCPAFVDLIGELLWDLFSSTITLWILCPI